MRLQPYDFELKFRPGKEMTTHDALSRYHSQPGPEISLDIAIHHTHLTNQQKLHFRMQLLQILNYEYCHKWLSMSGKRKYFWHASTLKVEDGTYPVGWSTTDPRIWMGTSPTTATWWTSGHYQDESSGKECNLLARNDKGHWVNDQQLQHLPKLSGETVWPTPRGAAYT